jgi:uncharacterized protein
VLVLSLAAWAGISSGCGAADGPGRAAVVPGLHFDTDEVRIATARDTFVVAVEIASTRQQRSQGLMERTSLPDDHGMLFVFPETQPPDTEFYMYRTHIPLDIAFIEPDGRIVQIMTMEPCTIPNPALCRRYAAGVPFEMALEVNAGYFQRRGIGPGATAVRRGGSDAGGS